MNQSTNMTLQLYQSNSYLQFHDNSKENLPLFQPLQTLPALSPRGKLRDSLEGRKEEEGLQW